MQRRRFIRSAALGAGAVLLSQCSKAKNPPNILFIFADDQCHEALGAFGSEVKTPNLDKLVTGGVTFSNAYNMGAWQGAVCIASRTMLNTGRFVWHAGELDKNLKPEEEAGRMWSQMMKARGYHTYFTGKWHVNNNPNDIFDTVTHVRPGMPKDHYDWSNPSAHHPGYDRPVEGEEDEWSPVDKKWGGFWEGGKHWSEVLGDDAESYLGTASKEQDPFFMYLAFNAPHDPRQSPQKYVDMYPADDVEVPENYMPEYPYKDAMGAGYGLRDERLAPFPRTEYSVRVNRQEYYAIITHMDEQIGRILTALEKSGKADNTWIFFTADHGLAVGQHGLMGKQNMFEHSVKAPLIVNGPGVPKNKTIDTPVYLQDIMATSLELSGQPIPEHVQFKSLLPLIKGKKQEQYEAIYCGYMKTQRMVRKGDYKLIKYPEVPVTLLFNIKEDPHEMNNLAGKKEYAGKIKELEAALKKLQEETGDRLALDA